jgi:hypothetical protein
MLEALLGANRPSKPITQLNYYYYMAQQTKSSERPPPFLGFGMYTYLVGLLGRGSVCCKASTYIGQH